MTLHQGDLCPHCGFIIVMPPDLDPICSCCSGNVLHEDESELKPEAGV